MSENSHLIPEQYVPDLDTGAIWTVKYVDPSGFECQLSIEASSGSEVLRKAQLVVEYFKEKQFAPILRVPSLPISKLDDKDEVHRCFLHGGVPLKRWEKNGNVWYAHKFEGRWCRGKG
jgi:hypothetical protein